MRELLSSKQYGYKFIEGLLISMGYNLNKIRIAFRKLTGIEPQIYMKMQSYLDTPGTIPGINYGWGASKDKNYDYLFVMPYNVGFSVFGQQGDITRHEVKHFATLDEAQDFLKSKVKDPQIYDPVVDVKLQKGTDFSSLSENWPIGTKTAGIKALFDYMDRMGDTIQINERRALLEDAYSGGDLTEEEFQKAAFHYGILRHAAPDVESISDTGNVDVPALISKDVKKDKEDAQGSSVKDELEEATPQSFFEQNRRDVMDTAVPSAVETIQIYFESMNQEMTDFEVKIFSFKYLKQRTTEKIEKTIPVGKQEVEEFFTSSGTISVIFDIKDNSLPAGKNIKQGLSIFSIIGDDVHTSGTFKGEDNKMYGLNSAGFEEYFADTREKQTKK